MTNALQVIDTITACTLIPGDIIMADGHMSEIVRIEDGRDEITVITDNDDEVILDPFAPVNVYGYVNDDN